MRRTCRIAAVARPLLIATVLFAAGCDGDRPLAPAGAPTTAAGGATLPADAPAAPVDTLTFVETFDDGSNTGDWSYGTTHEPTLEPDGGNPGWYLHDPVVVSFAPHPGSTPGAASVFAGDYRARRVISLGIDLRSFDYDLDVSARYLAILVMNDAGTPDDLADDWGAYCVGPARVPSKYLPMKDGADKNVAGWISYDFALAAQASAMPAGWSAFRFTSGSAARAGDSWRQLMQGVSYVQFWYGDPTQYYLLGTFDLGLDNPRIAWEVTG